ncbi:MAG: tyrosine-type recombinase/integrase [Planctomycetes bacterium]|nr:tyrosine-type recombinase/integrase [Planctomycetota bacterium]MCC7399517.1 tyrosine-type recombinase/integrase [Planctomycetota bacterium]
MSALPQSKSSKLKVPPLRSSGGYAYCFAGRRQVRLGRADDPETAGRYRTFVAEWVATGCRWPDEKRPEAVLTVQGIVDAYTKHVAEHYRRPSTGEATREGSNLKHAVVDLLELFRDLPAIKVDALVVKRVREAMVARGLCRKTVNDRVQRIQRMVRWAAEERLVPPSVHHEVKLVSPLKPGRGGAHDNPPRMAVSIEHVDAVKKHLPKPLVALVEFMLLTGARCGEAVQLASRYVDRAKEVWEFKPPKHKGEWRGHARVVLIGPKAQAAVLPFVREEPDRAWFRPCDVVEAMHAESRKRHALARRAKGQPLWPKHMARVRSKRKGAAAQLVPGTDYTANAIGHAIRRACDAAGIPRFGPHALRHAACGRIYAELGEEAAVATIGHGSPIISRRYTTAARQALAVRAAKQLG